MVIVWMRFKCAVSFVLDKAALRHFFSLSAFLSSPVCPHFQYRYPCQEHLLVRYHLLNGTYCMLLLLLFFFLLGFSLCWLGVRSQLWISVNLESSGMNSVWIESMF